MPVRDRWKRRDRIRAMAGAAFEKCGPNRKKLARATGRLTTRVHHFCHGEGFPRQLLEVWDRCLEMSEHPEVDAVPLIQAMENMLAERLAEVYTFDELEGAVLRYLGEETTAEAGENLAEWSVVTAFAGGELLQKRAACMTYADRADEESVHQRRAAIRCRALVVLYDRKLRGVH